MLGHTWICSKKPTRPRQTPTNLPKLSSAKPQQTTPWDARVIAQAALKKGEPRLRASRGESVQDELVWKLDLATHQQDDYPQTVLFNTFILATQMVVPEPHIVIHQPALNGWCGHYHNDRLHFKSHFLVPNYDWDNLGAHVHLLKLSMQNLSQYEIYLDAKFIPIWNLSRWKIYLDVKSISLQNLSRDEVRGHRAGRRAC